MYCASCGIAVSPHVSYCNRCDAELNAKDRSVAKRSEPSPESLVWALVSVTLVGIAAVIGLMGVMKEVVRFNDGLIIAFALLVFLAILGVDSVLIWLLLRPNREAKEAYRMAQQREFTTRELGEPKILVVPEPSLSVTEHTTHTLEPIDMKQLAK